MTANPNNKPALALMAACILSSTLVTSVYAGDMFHPPAKAGGIAINPSFTAIDKTATNSTASWYGLRGVYHVQTTPSLDTPAWSNVLDFVAADFGGSLTLPNSGGQNFTRLQTDNSFVGSGACAGCHGDKYSEWQGTHHATAWNTIAGMPPAVQSSCIVCHNVGVGQPTGFVSTNLTPQLANVGCENCHGAGGAHKFGDHSLIRPAVTIAAEVCGGCHTDAHHPTYDEWKESGHGAVTPELQTEFADPASGPGRQMSCGPCHSGAVRLAMLENYEDMLAGNTNYLALPTLHDASSYPQTCVVCHDPHSNDQDRQLRNPKFSTNFFALVTANVTTNIYTTNSFGVITTNTFYVNSAFASQYNPNIQVCAQCHNDRGGTWQSSSRPPHHSPQYNILIGAVQTNYLNGTNITMIATHGLRNPNGCSQCHMYPETPETITEENPAYTGHKFEVTLNGCVIAGCHSSTNSARILKEAVQADTTNTITSIVSLLNQWALTKSPDVLRTNYGALAWEYTTPGALSNAGTNSGPSSARQNSIPNTIKQARFNLYVIFHDASLGVHNPSYVQFMLQTATTNVQYELNK